ncbi:MAG: amino acid ABC transporter permease [Clostridia bacterium]|nr:amino acid ABC transporter permease [Clostridia bacterium]
MKKTLSFIVALIIYVVFFGYVIYKFNARPLAFDDFFYYKTVILKGWLNTILISLLSIFLSLFIGLILYLMEESRFKVLFYMSEIHKTIIFGTPLLVIAIIAYYYIGNAFNVDSKFFVGVITLGFYIAAYVSDIYKGAIESIHQNQWQAAKMFGFTKYQTYRYIIFPQVFKSILPPLAGQFALTIKGSALLSYMSTSEYLHSINKIMTINFRYTEGFIVIIFGYWIITVPLILLVRKLEKAVNYKV